MLMLLKNLREDARIYYGSGWSIAKLMGFFFNPSLRCVLIIRVCLVNKFLYYIFRNFLYWFHSCDIGYGSRIGPGLNLPHPLGIVIGRGSKVGKNVTIYQNVTLGSKNNGYPCLGDGVVVYPNSVLVDAIRIGKGSIIGANIFLCESVGEGEIYVGR